jgi:hypothetical protein
VNTRHIRLLARFSIPLLFLSQLTHSTDAQPRGAGDAQAILRNLPLYFEANLGQAEPGVRYVARSGGMTLLLSGESAAMLLAPPAGVKPVLLRMKLDGAEAGSASAAVADRLPGISNYFIGNNPRKWVTDVPQYRQVRFRGIYPGIDLIYYGNQQKVEYDFIVGAGVDPSRIDMSWEGADSVTLDRSGDLVIATAAGRLTQHKAKVYQEIDGERVEVDASYRLAKDNSVRLALAGYDTTRTLVIDPTLEFATAFTGAFGTSQAIALDAQKNIYIAGAADASAGIPLVNAFQSATSPRVQYYTFAAKFDPGGSTLLYSTYIGGVSPDISSIDSAFGIAVDNGGSAYIGGVTGVRDFPLASAAQNVYAGQADGYVTRLSAAGNQLLFSTYVGGSNQDRVKAIAIDKVTGNAYVTGVSYSSDLPTSAGAFQTVGFGAFAAKYGPSGTRLFTTYLGNGSSGNGIAVDSTGAAYITGDSSALSRPPREPTGPASPRSRPPSSAS